MQKGGAAAAMLAQHAGETGLSSDMVAAKFCGRWRNGKGPKHEGNTVINGFGRTIVTRGGVYCFFASISGLSYLAAMG